MIEKPVFDMALNFVVEREGGYVHNPADRGGETNLGITSNALKTAQDLGIVDKSLTVRALTRETVAPIYYALYWTPCRAEGRGYDTALTLFDAAVNHGPKQSIRLFQRGLNALGAGLSDDGIWGNKTEQAAVLAEAYYSTGACLAAIQKRADYYDSIVKNNPSQRVFLTGWMNRLAALRSEVIFS